MSNFVTINATYANGHTLSVLSDTIEKRRKYLNETAAQSVFATATNVLKSLRAVTRVAKKANIKVTVVPRSDLKFSYTSSQGFAKMCIRNNAGTRIENGQLGKIVFSGCYGLSVKSVKVFEFEDAVSSDKKTYIIAAPSASHAKKCAKGIVARRILRYSGLAKKAMSTLMVKTNNKGPSDPASFRVAKAADSVTKVTRTLSDNGNGGTFTLDIRDNLYYAVLAFNGRHSAVDFAMKKASNMTVGIIKHKCDKFLFPGELSTPFPEVSRKTA